MTTAPAENESPALSTIQAEDRLAAVEAAGDALRGMPEAQAADIVFTAHYILTGEHGALPVPPAAEPPAASGEVHLDGGDPSTV